MSETLHPMSLGEILDRTAQLYRRNFLSFAGIAAVPTASMLLLLIPCGAAIAFWAAGWKNNQQPTAAQIAFFVVFGLAIFVVAIAATVFSQAGLICAAASSFTGQKLTVREALGSVREWFWRYLGVLFLQGIAAVLIPAVIAGVAIAAVFLLMRAAGGGVGAGAAAGFAAFLIGVAAMVMIVLRGLSYSLAMPVSAIETKPAMESLRRSKKLAEGTRGRIFVMFLLIWALSMVVYMIAYVATLIVTVAVTAAAAALNKGGPAMMIALVTAEILNVLFNFAMQTLITPVYVVALVLFYFDQRIRTEGYDIEWMMQQAGLVEGTPQIAPEIASGPIPDAGTLNG